MSETEEYTTFSVRKKDGAIIRDFLKRASIDSVEFFSQLAKCSKVVIEDYLPESKRLMLGIYPKLETQSVEIRFDNVFSISELPSEIQSQIAESEKAKRLEEDGTPETAKIVERKFEVSPEHMKNILKQKGE